MGGHRVLNHSPRTGGLGRPQVLARASKAAVNGRVRVLLWKRLYFSDKNAQECNCGITG